MIDDSLNRDVVLRAALKVEQLAGSPHLEDAVDPEALAALSRAIGEQPAFGEEFSAAGFKAFIPNNVALALLQAMREEHIEQEYSGVVVKAAKPRGPLASRTVSFRGREEGFDDAFSKLDVKFVGTFLAALAKYLERRRSFATPSSLPRPYALAADARVVIVGDWATGERIADEVADRIREQLADASSRQTHVVHLGDLYYAGTRWEAENRFLPHWPVKPEEADRHSSWCLNGNHDMYAAGEGLLGSILTDPRFRHQRTTEGGPTTEFHLKGEHWQLFGLDTARHFDFLDLRGESGNIETDQVRWIEDGIASSSGAGTVLLSHHQPFTRQHRGADGLRVKGNLLAMTERIRNGPGVDCWFWGHEHRLFTYGPRDGIRYPVCTGHGAIPTDPGHDHAEEGEREYCETFKDGEGDTWRRSGFTMLDLAGTEMSVQYIDQAGELWSTPHVLTRR